MRKLRKQGKGNTPKRREANALHLASLQLLNYAFKNLLKQRKQRKVRRIPITSPDVASGGKLCDREKRVVPEEVVVLLEEEEG